MPTFRESSSGAKAGTSPTSRIQSFDSAADKSGSIENRIWLLIVAIFVLNVVSTLLFIRVVNRPVYDDQENMQDVHTYATQGVSIATIRAQKNSPGPVSFVWMAATVRLLRGDELRDARISALVSWVFIVAAISIGARYTSFPHLWYGALLTALVFPHSVEATVLVLTEGPALLFAMVGSLAWVEFASRQERSAHSALLGIVGGLSIGLAATSRQYFLALLPAAVILTFRHLQARNLRASVRWYACVVISLLVAALPILSLTAIWKGLSSPSMAAGASYPLWTARVGLNLSRPIIAAFYVAFYLLPLTFPAMLQLEGSRRRRACWVGLVGGAAAGYFSSFILQWGPLRSSVRFLARGTTTGQSVLFGVIAVLTIYNAIAIVFLLWRRRSELFSNPLVIFAVLTVIFFVAEQFGVGGDTGLYDRYCLQLAPFLGIVAFWLFPRLMRVRVVALVCLSLVSQIMLWRFAFASFGS